VRRLAALLAILALTASPAVAAPAEATTRVFSLVPAPGFPAYVHAHGNGRVYAGTYVAGDAAPSKVFEWRRDGTLLRSWEVPGQVLDADHGVQVAQQTRAGRLVLLETSTASVLTLDLRTGRFRTVAQLPEGAVPNYATWGPGGALLVSDYADGVIWRLPPGDRTPERWFESPALTGAAGFGTTGLRYRPGRHDLLVTQQTATDGAALPTNGHLSSLPVEADGSPGELRTIWTSQPGDLPDGFGIGRSGHVYVALAGLANQLVELAPDGTEVRRIGAALTGDNGSAIPFDTPCSATFLGDEVLVANQSAIAGDATHQAVLAVDVGERGRAPYLPRGARFGR
jgi:hypothetical protein